jgi:hypothetical protein
MEYPTSPLTSLVENQIITPLGYAKLNQIMVWVLQVTIDMATIQPEWIVSKHCFETAQEQAQNKQRILKNKGLKALRESYDTLKDEQPEKTLDLLHAYDKAGRTWAEWVETYQEKLVEVQHTVKLLYHKE